MWESALARVAHPPVDAILLQTLAADPRYAEKNRRVWRMAKWTTLDEARYFDLIGTLRAEQLDQPEFWRVERYWSPKVAVAVHDIEERDEADEGR